MINNLFDCCLTEKVKILQVGIAKPYLWSFCYSNLFDCIVYKDIYEES